MRKAARTAAGRFTWSSVLDRALLPLLRELGVTLQASPAAGSKRMQEREKPNTAATEPAITAPDYLLAAAATRAVAPPIAPA